MTIVVELRDLKKGLPRPITQLWQRATNALCVLRVRLACVALLGVALASPLEGGPAPYEGALAMLCAVLTAVVSATAGLLCDAGSDVLALFGDPANSAFRLQQGLSLCCTEPA